MGVADDDHESEAGAEQAREDHPVDFHAYPPGFETWNRAAQVTKIAGRYRREGLFEEVLVLAGLDLESREINTQTKLTKEELAAIKLELEGIDHD